MPFPSERPRRLRRSERLRALVRETRLSPEQLIYPLFIAPGSGLRREIPSLPGCFHVSAHEAAREAREVESLGVAGVILFGLPEGKDPVGSQGYAADGVVQEPTRAIRAECRELLVVTDVCLCEYTSHGHCGLVADGEVKNDPTLELLAAMALSHVEAWSWWSPPSTPRTASPTHETQRGCLGVLRRAEPAVTYPWFVDLRLPDEGCDMVCSVRRPTEAELATWALQDPRGAP